MDDLTKPVIEDAVSDAPEDIDDQALAWVMRLTSGTSDTEVLLSYEAWRKADPRHEQALLKARRLWLGLGVPLEQRYDPVMARRRRARQYSGWRSRLGWGRQGTPVASSASPRPASNAASLAWAKPTTMAASILLTCVLAHQWSSNWRHDHVTSVGEQRTLVLNDGSTLWLNSGSAADIDMRSGQRRIDLVRGEVFVDVTHDPYRPFIVNAGIGQVRVLGTAFGVQRDGDDVLVTVQRGKVQVSGGGTAPVTITPDQRVRVHAGDKVKRVELVSADDMLAWRSGQLVFIDRPLSEVLSEVARYDNRMLLVQYDDASKVRINAVIDLARIDQWYDGLQSSLPVKVTMAGPVVWLRPVGSKV